MQKLDIEQLREFAKRKEGELISTKYKDCKTPVRWRCKNGHEWDAIFSSVKQGHWCNTCCAGRKKKIAEERNQLVAQTLANQRGAVVLSKIIPNYNSEVLWKCKDGHIFKKRLSLVKKGRWCEVCLPKKYIPPKRDASEIKKQKEERFLLLKKIAAQRGGEILSKEYINKTTFLEFRCSQNHFWKATPSNIIGRNSWCKKCAAISLGKRKRKKIEDIAELAKRFGGELISKKNLGVMVNHVWRCSEGHIFEAAPNRVKSGGWCPFCSDKISERICRAALEGLLNAKFPTLKPEWLINSRGNRMELDGYNADKKIAFEYHGEQHFKKNQFSQTDEKLFQRMEDDTRKRYLCKKHGVLLIEIHYQTPKDKIHSEIKKVLKENGKEVSLLETQDLLKKAFLNSDIERMRMLATQNGGLCLSSFYVDSHTKLIWQCAKGHVWESKPNWVQQGQWCSLCNKERRSIQGLEEAKKIALSKGGRLLAPTYKNSYSKMEWECSEGHRWHSSLHPIKYQGAWCFKCLKNKKNKKRYAKALKIAEQRGGKLISEKYTSTTSKMTWQCSVGHQWESSINNIKYFNRWCPHCKK